MCGRFSFSQSNETIAEIFQLDEVPQITPRYNLAPTQLIPTVLVTDEEQKRQFKMLQWGLIPGWAKDPKMGARMINAKAETVSEKPAFRSAFKKRRCLVLADGFYEWHEQNGEKQPFYFRLKQSQPFAFAGLWEHWKDAEGEVIESCTIITTEANDIVRPIHDRMPVILAPDYYEQWLDPKVQKPELLQPLLQPYHPEEMTAYAVSTKVNSPRHDSPECIEKVE